jgi:hypothetical protein
VFYSGTNSDLIFNPFIGGLCPSCTGGASTITVNAIDSLGNPQAPAVFTGLTVGNGENFLTITTSGGEQIVSTTVDVAGGFNDLRQPRISGPFTPHLAVPEPASMAPIGGGLLALALTVRRRKRVS